MNRRLKAFISGMASCTVVPSYFASVVAALPRTEEEAFAKDASSLRSDFWVAFCEIDAQTKNHGQGVETESRATDAGAANLG